MSHLDSLNERQREAAASLEGPLLVIAGAGSGKTKTIAHRILEIVHSGVPAHHILAITFTNKAAREMRERINNLLASDKNLNLPIHSAERPFVSTFHALGVFLLRRFGTTVGVRRGFSILDKADSRQAVKESVQELGLDPKQFEPAVILSVISKEKGKGISLGEYRRLVEGEYRFGNITADVWEKYESALTKGNALDFDDLLLKTLELLNKDPRAREFCQKSWTYLHIDEYQDTNLVQNEIVKILAGEKRNICAVGDGDQTIYVWRGATIRNIIQFERDFPGAKVVMLEENYRSTGNILTAANLAIGKNKLRVPKNLFTKNPAGEKIGLYVAYDEEDEARFIARRAKGLIERGEQAEEISVLYRANFQSRILEQIFLDEGVPYQLVGTRFFERREIKDLLSYLRLLENPTSPADLKRALTTPPRGIGKVSLTKIIAGGEQGLSPAGRRGLAEFRSLLEEIRNAAKTTRASELVRLALIESGLETEYKNGGEEGRDRLENVQELVTLAKKYDDLPPPEGLEKFLTDAALQSDQDELSEDNTGVRLMTIHSAKGLEFNTVFLPGLEEGLFPHERDDKDGGEADEEERRLFYVGLTRARKKIILSYANVRTIFGLRAVTAPSEFVIEFDDALLEAEAGITGEKTIYF